MNRIFLSSAFTMVLVALAVSTLGRQTATTQNASPETQEPTIPEHVVYGMFLRDLSMLSEKAADAARKGDEKSRAAYQNFYKSRAGWSNEELVVLNQIAIDCQRHLKTINAKAKRVIEARQKLYYPDNKVRPEGQLAPPSPELKELQAEHDAVILTARDQIRLTLGEQSFQRLQQFLKRTVVPTITVSKVGN
jgi:hypothetical protein